MSSFSTPKDSIISGRYGNTEVSVMGSAKRQIAVRHVSQVSRDGLQSCNERFLGKSLFEGHIRMKKHDAPKITNWFTGSFRCGFGLAAIMTAIERGWRCWMMNIPRSAASASRNHKQIPAREGALVINACNGTTLLHDISKPTGSIYCHSTYRCCTRLTLWGLAAEREPSLFSFCRSVLWELH